MHGVMAVTSVPVSTLKLTAMPLIEMDRQRQLFVELLKVLR